MESDMFNVMCKKFIPSVVLGALLLPTFALAATPTAFLEKSQIIATGKKISVFRVPTRDIDGKIKYFDFSATFNVLDGGQIDTTTSTIVSKLSPNFAANTFVPGTYKTNNGDTTCTLGTTVLNGGRMQATLNCIKGVSDININWISGSIPGHPFELDLLAANIDDIPAYQNFTWGKVILSDNSYWFGCMSTTDIVSATQIGGTIQLLGYNQSNTQACGDTLFKQ